MSSMAPFLLPKANSVVLVNASSSAEWLLRPKGPGPIAGHRQARAQRGHQGSRRRAGLRHFASHRRYEQPSRKDSLRTSAVLCDQTTCADAALPSALPPSSSERDAPRSQNEETRRFQRVSMERMKGLEPSTFCMASRRSSQLSYIREFADYSRLASWSSAWLTSRSASSLCSRRTAV